MTKAERKKAYDEAQRDRAYLEAIWEKLFCLEVSEDPDAEEWEFLGDYLERGIVRLDPGVEYHARRLSLRIMVGYAGAGPGDFD